MSALRQNRCTAAAPASSAVAALSKAEAPAPMIATCLPRKRAKSIGCAGHAWLRTRGREWRAGGRKAQKSLSLSVTKRSGVVVAMSGCIATSRAPDAIHLAITSVSACSIGYAMTTKDFPDIFGTEK